MRAAWAVSDARIDCLCFGTEQVRGRCLDGPSRGRRRSPRSIGQACQAGKRGGRKSVSKLVLSNSPNADVANAGRSAMGKVGALISSTELQHDMPQHPALAPQQPHPPA
jgi:hypothetical protein